MMKYLIGFLVGVFLHVFLGDYLTFASIMIVTVLVGVLLANKFPYKEKPDDSSRTN